MLASIKTLSRCPHPRCLVVKKRALELGMKRNNRDVVSKAREVSNALRSHVPKARKSILDKGRGVKSDIVEELLGEESLMPVEVCWSSLATTWLLN